MRRHREFYRIGVPGTGDGEAMSGPLETCSNEAREAPIAYRELAREHDRLRTLFDIINALVSKLGREELFCAIFQQLSNIIRHDYAC